MANVGSRSLKTGRQIRYPGRPELVGTIAAIQRTPRGVMVVVQPPEGPEGTGLGQVEVGYAEAVQLLLPDRPAVD